MTENQPTALVVTVDGTVTLEAFPEGDSLAFLQAKVEGYVDVVSLSEHVDMWVNDEGLMTHDVNPVATMIAAGFGMDHQPYHGPVVFTGGADDEGTTLPLAPEWAIELQAAAEWLTA